MKQNVMAPAFLADLAATGKDGKPLKCQFRADQNAIYELEEVTGLPVGAWLMGQGESTFEIDGLDRDGKPAKRVATRRGRLLELAWAMAASWRQSEAADLTEPEFRQLLPVGEDWDELSKRLEETFLDSFFLAGRKNRPSQASPQASDPTQAPGPTGDAESSRA